MTGPAGHIAHKRFGQNFLVDESVLDALIGFIAPNAEDKIIEIGPGRAALTARLLRRVPKMSAVEIDRDLAAWLRGEFPTLEVIEADALKLDWKTILEGSPIRVVGNLPYNISSPILFALLGAKDRVIDQHFMLQREMVDRMVAKPSTKAYGRLSVMLQAYYDMAKLCDIGPQAFYPAPKVFSAFVRMVPKKNVPDVDFSQFEKVVKAAFSLRRKTLRNALAGVLTEDEIRKADIDPSVRAETLDVNDFVRLTKVYASKA
ncbi:MAG TPA: 16S rRNA (adenine(1518)-N(6)/adenine(1519)-N(6))-dimethyltransferase [Sutterella sp.]|nr:16S rRNA (adenine(1518)-N(6)/adenine(1519)-N(6))-dimethyltransferase [Sutterella sp.]